MDLVTSASLAKVSIRYRAATLIAGVLALRAGLKHRRELQSLTPDMRADFVMTDREYEAALNKPVTAYPDFVVARENWRRRILKVIDRSSGQE